MDEFFRTRMGVRFFNTTLPKIAAELERLNANLEALVIELHEKNSHPLQDAAEVSEKPENDPQ